MKKKILPTLFLGNLPLPYPHLPQTNKQNKEYTATMVKKIWKSQSLLVDYLGTGNSPAGEDKPEERVKGEKTALNKVVDLFNFVFYLHMIHHKVKMISKHECTLVTNRVTNLLYDPVLYIGHAEGGHVAKAPPIEGKNRGF